MLGARKSASSFHACPSCCFRQALFHFLQLPQDVIDAHHSSLHVVPHSLLQQITVHYLASLLLTCRNDSVLNSGAWATLVTLQCEREKTY